MLEIFCKSVIIVEEYLEDDSISGESTMEEKYSDKGL